MRQRTIQTTIITMIAFVMVSLLLIGFAPRALAADATDESETTAIDGVAPADAYGAYALLYSNGDFVLQRGSTPDNSRGRVLKTFTNFERPANPLTFNPPWAEMIPESDRLFDDTGERVAYGDYVTRVVIEDRLSPTSTAQWFWHFSRLTTIEDLERLDTSGNRSMRDMFAGCAALPLMPPIAALNTSRVIDMEGLFSGCSSIPSISVRGIDFSTVQDLSLMFAGCTALTSIDLSGISAPDAQRMMAMFADCVNLKTVSLAHFSAPKNMVLTSLFANDTSLESIDFNGFSTGNAQDFSFMFMGCSSLKSLDLSGFDTSSATTMRDMFNGCSALTGLNLAGFSTNHVTDMASMFTDCGALLTLDLTSFNTANVTSMYGMFMGCSGLRSLNLSTFNLGKIEHNTSKGNDAWLSAYMFAGCDSLARVTVGTGFVFHDGGKLPAGEWKNSATGATFTAENVPSRVAATYTRDTVDPDPPASDAVEIHRVYNGNTGEHLYTVSAYERDELVALGWKDEGIAWVAPKSSNTPVYRLYNPSSGDHFYTANRGEYDRLGLIGWNREGACWYSDDAQTMPLYRLYNKDMPVGTHLFTKDANEYEVLVDHGWRQEGIAWYGLK